MKEGILGYNYENNRFGLLISDLWEHDGLHCGDVLEVKINDQWIKTRIEMDWQDGKGTWYLVNTPYRGMDLEYLKVRIYY